QCRGGEVAAALFLFFQDLRPAEVGRFAEAGDLLDQNVERWTRDAELLRGGLDLPGVVAQRGEDLLDRDLGGDAVRLRGFPPPDREGWWEGLVGGHRRGVRLPQQALDLRPD